MHFSTGVLVAAATASVAFAAPTARDDTKFHIDFTVEGHPAVLSANPVLPAAPNGGQYFLEGKPVTSNKQGPLAYISNRDLVFDTHTDYYIGYNLITSVKDVGDAPGAVFPVVAFEAVQHNGDDPKWSVTSDGHITHEKAAALNTFFLCKKTVNGREASILHWGNPTADLKAPEGCQYTTLRKN